MLKIEQLLIDAYRCDANLDDADFLMETLELAAKEVKAKIVRRVTQKFDPVGVGAILILAETHLSAHTWPEHRYAAVDIFICGEEKDPHKVWSVIKGKLKPQSIEINELIRSVGDTRIRE
jgi:S-adenosylmethionine decarboxylase